MSYYITDFHKIRQEKSVLRVLEALERGFLKFGIDYYLVGAVAREVWMRGIHDITSTRATSDIDFAILIRDSEHYDTLQSYLISKEGFSSVRENAFVLIAPNGIEIDLLPFGAIEKEGKVAVKGMGMTTIHLDGMREVYEEAVLDVTFENTITFKVCTLPGIVLLKLIAWDDRPEMRSSDLADIADILSHFFYIYDELIWSQHHDLFDQNLSLDRISARVLGREMGKILCRNEGLKLRILDMLSNHSLQKREHIAIAFATSLGQTLEEAGHLIDAISQGIRDLKPATC